MSTIGNILWLICGGFISGMGYIIGGMLLCLTIIGIPFGSACIKLGLATMAPFGKNIVEDPDANSAMKLIGNLIWIVLFGWAIAVSHLVHAAALAVTIIGWPFAWQHIKLVPVALMPFGISLR